MFRAVALDFDWTFNTSRMYYDRFDKVSGEVLAERFGCSVEEADLKIRAVMKKTLSFTSAVRRVGLDSEEFYGEVAGRMDMRSLLKGDARLKEIVLTLRRMGLKVAMLTNSGRSLLKGALDVLGCPFENFDAVVTSDEVEPKPSLQPFLYTAELLKCRPEDVLYVGDRVFSELKPAKQAGMKTVLVGSEADPEEDRWVGWTLKDVHQLPELVKNLQSDAAP